MSREHLQASLQQLRDQLASPERLNDEERATLIDLLQDIELRLAEDAASAPDASLVEGLNLAVERFESEHPTLSAALRNVVQTLGNMGI